MDEQLNTTVDTLQGTKSNIDMWQKANKIKLRQLLVCFTFNTKGRGLFSKFQG